MKNWNLHWLQAAGDLDRIAQAARTELSSAHAALAPFLEPPDLDILIERSSEGVIAELGLAAVALTPNRISVLIDPDHDAIEKSLADGALQRRVVHSVHQALRQAGPGYGYTLGGALVSEGLAGLFVRLVLNSPPEPWETALSNEDLRIVWPTQRDLISHGYDHAAWFSGSANLPRWTGYTIARHLVEAWMVSGVDLSPHRLLDVPAPKVLACAGAGLLAS